MAWNYRMVKYADGTGYGVHEVHYDKRGDAISMTESAATFSGDTAKDVRSSLTKAKMDAFRYPVFDEPGDWS